MNLSKIKLIVLLSIVLLTPEESFCQEGSITVLQEKKFEQLLNEKRKINSSITINDRYKIQIFNGDSEKSRKILMEFKKENKSLD